MVIEEIIANALDLAGGAVVRNSLDTDQATLVCLNVIDTMMLELGNSSKAIKGAKVQITLTANIQTGQLSENDLSLGSFFVRFRQAVCDQWQMLDIVDDIEDLTRRENERRQAIMFSGINPLTYNLSWKPEQNISAELWGKSFSAEIEDLKDLPPFPVAFSLLCAYRMVPFVLNQLIALDAKRWMPFVERQEKAVEKEQSRIEFVWRKYRANPAAANSVSQVAPYDMYEEMRNDFDQSGLVNNYVI